MPATLLYVTYALAVARVCRLIAEDKIFEGPRNAILKRLPDDSNVAYLILCRWCLSVWVALPAAVIAVLWGEKPWFLIPAVALAFSHLVGLAVRLEGD